ncbi:potassium/proton antiporter [Ferrovibrio terrae]|uniref:Potassium/proton antiporter n=1 Tax=Ferrovibrio terrae TaxID=2594003 RepID=A0A516H4J9_9PROT|nr:potassium/proton antiporter [Ferrovibrio terrae]QDO98560.1 potassium/proton antiporter [Ferrovibrio terrae]
MNQANEILFIASLLVLVSIFAGSASSRFGVPFLLVFLGLGLLAGEGGPGGIVFNDYQLTYSVGSAALGIILFDGGLRTHFSTVRLVVAPAFVLATVGVVVTAGLVGVAAHYALGLGLLESFLVGAIVGSTDAAAVFFLLNMKGLALQKRVSGTLEVESGINDPMAIFLTLMAVELLRHGQPPDTLQLVAQFLVEMVGGLMVGVAGGFLLVALFNRVPVAGGLYPIVAMAAALLIFSGAYFLHASGYVAVYVAGLVLGNRRHRGAQVILRFYDGLSWLSQIVMFLLLGLLMTPDQMKPYLAGSGVVAGILIVLARPVAVLLCLVPFRYSFREIGFISWIGLRGAVPIFLATIPVLAKLPNSDVYVTAAFVCVLASLTLQGWTIAPVARFFGLELPPKPEAVSRTELDLGSTADRDVASYRVEADAPALGYRFTEIPLPRRSRIITVIRDGTVMDRLKLDHLETGDYILVLAPAEQFFSLDRLFTSRETSKRRKKRDRGEEVFGEFVLTGDTLLGEVALLYGLPVEEKDRGEPVGSYMRRRLRHRAVVGDRVRWGPVELVAREIRKDRVTSIGIELEPEEHPIWRGFRRAFGFD